MPKFNVTFSRPTYESAVVQIEANSEEHANDKAIFMSDEDLDQLEWEHNGWNRGDSIDIDYIEEVEKEPAV